jgi:hypothetical protein
MTFTAGRAAAASSALTMAVLEAVASPKGNTRKATMVASGAVPAMPALSSSAAATAATAVPWVASESGSTLVPPVPAQVPLEQSPPSTTLPAPFRSGLSAATPSSMTAISTPSPSMRSSAAQAAAVCMVARSGVASSALA